MSRPQVSDDQAFLIDEIQQEYEKTQNITGRQSVNKYGLSFMCHLKAESHSCQDFFMCQLFIFFF